MSTKPYRWLMVEPGRPMVRTEFEIGELAADQVVVRVETTSEYDSSTQATASPWRLMEINISSE